MKPSAFEYFEPTTLDEALSLKASFSDARWLAGGQSLVPLMNMRMAAPEVLVDLNRISELAEVRVEDGWIRIGGMIRHHSLIANPTICQHVPLLPLVAARIGHLAIRNRGTLGGSLAHADPSAELGLAMVALDALVVARNALGDVREVPIDQFIIGPLMTVLEKDELLVAVKIPLPEKPVRWCFDEVSRRHGDFALVSAAVGQGAGTVRVAVCGVEGCARRLKDVETWLQDKGGDGLDAVFDQVVGALEPDAGDLHGSGWYRQQVAGHLVKRLVREVMDHAH